MFDMKYSKFLQMFTVCQQVEKSPRFSINSIMVKTGDVDFRGKNFTVNNVGICSSVKLPTIIHKYSSTTQPN